jgi:hypothetical protein
VKRSFRHTERQKLFSELQMWNTALKNCLSKPEVHSDESDPLTARLLLRFDAKLCEDARTNAEILHQIWADSWAQKCRSHEHLSNLQMNWHLHGFGLARAFTLVVPRCCSQQQSSESWQQVSVEIVERHGSCDNSRSPGISSPTTKSGQRTTEPVPASFEKRSKKLQFFVPVDTAEPESVGQSSVSQNQETHGTKQLTGSELISSLCATMQKDTWNGYLSHPDSHITKISA